MDFSRISDRELDQKLSQGLSDIARSCVDERERRIRAEYDREIGFLRGSLAAFRKTAHPDIKLRPGKDNGPCIPAHTAILASSSKIFEQMLQCEATPEHTITIPELNSEELESLLEFLYNGSLISDKMEKHVRSFFRAAHKYEILYLQQCCERCILDSLSASNVLDALESYDFFSSPAIKELALRLVVDNMNDIMLSDKYEVFAINYPHVAVQITNQKLKLEIKTSGMSDSESNKSQEVSNASTVSGLDEITLQLARMLRNVSSIQNPNPSLEKITLSVKLNGENYPLWSRLMKFEIRIRGMTGHITGEASPPAVNDPGFLRWEQEDLQVFSWILHNLESLIMNTVFEFQTAKALWDVLAVTYGSGGDALQIYDLQIYDLHNQASRQTQGDRPLEDYWNDLQALWLAIDERRENPRKCDRCLAEHNRVVQVNRLLNFLCGLDQRFDAIRREILWLDPLPTVEASYAAVLKEAARLRILASASNDRGEIGSRVISKKTSGGDGSVDRNRNRLDSEVDRSRQRCTHCGMAKHTKETCYELIGFPEWWSEKRFKMGKPKKNARAAVAIGESGASSSDDGARDARLAGHKENSSGSGRGFAAIGLGRDGSGSGGTEQGSKFRGDYWAWH